jgi:hypothetical protein
MNKMMVESTFVVMKGPPMSFGYPRASLSDFARISSTLAISTLHT